MSEENVEIVRRAHAAFARGDLEQFLSLIDPDIEFTSLIVEAETGGTFRGHEGVMRWFTAVSDASGDFHAEVQSVRALDRQRAIAELRMSGVTRGLEVAQTMWQAAVVRGGKLVWWRIYRTEEEALEAAELRGSRAVSRENVDVVWRAFEGAGARGLEETAATYWHPEVVYVEDPRWPGASTYKGRDAVLRCFRDYMDALGREDDLAITVERVFDAGERQIPFVRVRSRASTSGVPHEHLWGYVVEVSDEQIVYFRAYYEPGEALEAVGLPD